MKCITWTQTFNTTTYTDARFRGENISDGTLPCRFAASTALHNVQYQAKTYHSTDTDDDDTKKEHMRQGKPTWLTNLGMTKTMMVLSSIKTGYGPYFCFESLNFNALSMVAAQEITNYLQLHTHKIWIFTRFFKSGSGPVRLFWFNCLHKKWDFSWQTTCRYNLENKKNVQVHYEHTVWSL